MDNLHQLGRTEIIVASGTISFHQFKIVQESSIYPNNMTVNAKQLFAMCRFPAFNLTGTASQRHVVAAVPIIIMIQCEPHLAEHNSLFI